MTRYSQDHKQTTRERILVAAETLIKDRGPQSATVEAVMRGAGLTVGGFYAHFDSKEALAREALLAGVERSFATMTTGLDDSTPEQFATALIDRYLAQLEDQRLASACPLTVLLPEVARADQSFRDEFTSRTGALIAGVEARLPVVEGMAPRDVALAVFATLTGAVTLARASNTMRGRRRVAAVARTSLSRLLRLPAHTV